MRKNWQESTHTDKMLLFILFALIVFGLPFLLIGLYLFYSFETFAYAAMNFMEAEDEEYAREWSDRRQKRN